MAKRKPDKLKVDGKISAKEIERLRNAIRQVWQWTSVARRNCIKRATDKKGFGKCEECRQKVPKVYADHIEVMGSIFARDYIKRMWCHSRHLQALCKKCHDRKTRQERKADKMKMEAQVKPKKFKNFTDIY